MLNRKVANMNDFYDINAIMTKEVLHGTIRELSSVVENYGICGLQQC